MNFIMQIDEQILLIFEGAMGFHSNRKKEKKMPYMCFKKNIELDLNSFLTPKGMFYCAAIADILPLGDRVREYLDFGICACSASGIHTPPPYGVPLSRGDGREPLAFFRG